jgi:hypothetical protein
VAFLLWAGDLLLPSGRLASTLHDVIICLLVLSVALTMFPRLKRGPQVRE